MTLQTKHWTNWIEAEHALSAAARILIVTHVHPDGDAIGSLLGLANWLWARGKSVDAAVDEGVPDFLEFLPNSGRVMPSLTSGDWDVMVTVDASDQERTGTCGVYGFAHSQTVINIDHHRTNTGFGDIHLIIPDAVSTTDVLYQWLTRMNEPITRDLAVTLLTGLVTDTMGFRTNHTTANTLGIAQALIASGASLHDIMERTLNSQKYMVVELWKRALSTVTLIDGVISAEVRQADLREIGLEEVPDTGLVNWLVAVDTASIAVLFKEQANNTVEISLRSDPNVDVSGVALALGGGGHRQASGATIEGSLEAVRARVMPMLTTLTGTP